MNHNILITKEEYKDKVRYTLVNKAVKYRLDKIKSLFHAQTIKGKDLTRGQPLGGRGNTTFINYKNMDLVVKQYRRGGLIAKVSMDKYFWLGIKKTRAYREMLLLLEMEAMDLPVPKAFAAKVSHYGLLYSEDIITLKLEGAKTLVEISENTHQHWQEVGRLIKRFHDKNIYHADLNAHNILISNDSLYLIDFDKAKRYLGTINFWKKSNLSRLRRSLNKLSKQNKIVFDDDNWLSLLDGYMA